MVWSTTQSSLYEAERAGGRCECEREAPREDHCETPHETPRKAHCEPSREKPRGKRPAQTGLFVDGDTLLIFGLVMILMREKADRNLIFALLAAFLL